MIVNQFLVHQVLVLMFALLTVEKKKESNISTSTKLPESWVWCSTCTHPIPPTHLPLLSPLAETQFRDI